MPSIEEHSHCTWCGAVSFPDMDPRMHDSTCREIGYRVTFYSEMGTLVDAFKNLRASMEQKIERLTERIRALEAGRDHQTIIIG